jgi:hypothetical protein
LVFTDPVFTDPVFTDPVFTDPVFTDPVFTDPVFTDQVILSDQKAKSKLMPFLPNLPQSETLIFSLNRFSTFV